MYGNVRRSQACFVRWFCVTYSVVVFLAKMSVSLFKLVRKERNEERKGKGHSAIKPLTPLIIPNLSVNP